MNIVHKPDQACFELEKNGGVAVLEYRVEGTHIDFCHTYVPPSLRGGRLAYDLVHYGLQWARSQGLFIHASCWYVAKCIDRESRGE